MLCSALFCICGFNHTNQFYSRSLARRCWCDTTVRYTFTCLLAFFFSSSISSYINQNGIHQFISVLLWSCIVHTLDTHTHTHSLTFTQETPRDQILIISRFFIDIIFVFTAAIVSLCSVVGLFPFHRLNQNLMFCVLPCDDDDDAYIDARSERDETWTKRRNEAAVRICVVVTINGHFMR